MPASADGRASRLIAVGESRRRAQRTFSPRKDGENIMPVEPSMPARLILYDGGCGLCDSLVQWLVARDRLRKLHFAPLEGKTAATIRARHPEVPQRSVDTIVYVVHDGDDERVFLRSEAAFRIAADLDLRWLARVGVLPHVVTDLGYRVVARLRYRLWGKLAVCRIPNAADAPRFLD